jgi:peptide/nickel transport system permease protein
MAIEAARIPILAPDELETPPLSLGELTWRRFRRHKLAIFGAVVLVLLFFYSFGGALLAHPFGTDTIGRDILARTIYGGQISLLIGLFAVIVETGMGVVVGALAGYYGGALDNILMRITEAMLNIPEIFLLIVMAKFFSGKIPDYTIFGRTFSGSVILIILIIGGTSWMYLARIVRAEFLSLKENEFVLAARATGTSNLRIIFLHILPNSIAPIVVSATLGVANAILSEAYISFLGLGVQPPTATWGNMLDGANNYLDTAPWLWFFPALLILLTVLSINFLGDGLRDALDPRSRTV